MAPPPERVKLGNLIVVAAAVVAILGSVLILRGRPPAPTESEEARHEGESRARTRSGALALARTLRQLGAHVEPHERRFDLIQERQSVLVSVAADTNWDQGERDGLMNWMRKGGTLLWLPPTDSGEDMLDDLGLEWTKAKDATPREVAVHLARFHRDLPGDLRLSVTSTARLAPTDPSDARPLADDADGWTVAWVPVGRGGAIVFSEPTSARNDRLSEADHATILVTLAMTAADGGTIAFDEFHHGFIGGQHPFVWLHSTPVWPALWHLTALGFLLLLGVGRRLGPPRVIRDTHRRRPTEFVEAFARLARASAATGLAVQLVLDNVIDGARRRFGTTDPEAIGREAARRGLDGDFARATLVTAQQAARERPAPATMVRSIADLERLRRGLVSDREAW